MNKNYNFWEKLTRLARQAPEPGPAEMPYGFATRVVANRPTAAPGAELSAAWESLSVRSLALAALVMAFTLGLNYDLMNHDWTQEVTPVDTAFEPLLEP
jgi:hypothetical protein